MKKSYKLASHSLGLWTQMEEGGPIILPTSDFNLSDTIDLDHEEKILLGKVEWPELSDEFHFDSPEIISLLSEVVVELTKVKNLKLKWI